MKRNKRSTWVIGPQTRTLSQAWQAAERKGLTPLTQRLSLTDLQAQRDRLDKHVKALTIDLQRALMTGNTRKIAVLDRLRADHMAKGNLVLAEIARRLDMRAKAEGRIGVRKPMGKRALYSGRTAVKPIRPTVEEWV